MVEKKSTEERTERTTLKRFIMNIELLSLISLRFTQLNGRKEIKISHRCTQLNGRNRWIINTTSKRINKSSIHAIHLRYLILFHQNIK